MRGVQRCGLRTSDGVVRIASRVLASAVRPAFADALDSLFQPKEHRLAKFVVLTVDTFAQAMLW